MWPNVQNIFVLATVSYALAKTVAAGTSPLLVDLGYAKYHGYHNASNGLNIWNGVRYAAPPLGNLRFQAPQPPLKHVEVQFANATPPQCPQGDPSDDEDCLYLSVYAPQNASNLPVLIWIHGGGYLTGGIATYDLQYLMSTIVDTPFVAIAIQYRLGALGFLASEEIKKEGSLNCGLLDQRAAMAWVQRYAVLFGGDPDRVTIAGESAGGGSVMLHAIAGRGSYGTSLFRQIWAASPYLPFQYAYNDASTTNIYHDLISRVGCSSTSAFACLLKVPVAKLVNATLEMAGPGFVGYNLLMNPVTDGEYIQSLPSVQLAQGPVNGERILSGNNANEGLVFAPANISTNDQFDEYVKNLLPLLSENSMEKLKLYYPESLDDSEIGVGPGERLRKLVADFTINCPSLWLAESFPESYKYQFSVPPAIHGQDVCAYFTSVPGTDLDFIPVGVRDSFREMLFSFITTGSPAVDDTHFQQFSSGNPLMLNFNATGPSQTITGLAAAFDVPVRFLDPSSKSNITLLNAYKIDSERGTRCDFLRSYGKYLPA